AMVVGAEFACPIPDALDDVRAAPLLCAGAVGLRALKRSEVQSGERLGLYGFGGSAHLVLQLARARNIACFVFTRGEHHRALARSPTSRAPTSRRSSRSVRAATCASRPKRSRSPKR